MKLIRFRIFLKGWTEMKKRITAKKNCHRSPAPGQHKKAGSLLLALMLLFNLMAAAVPSAVAANALGEYEGYFEVFDAEAVESSVAPSAEMRAEGKKYYDAEVTYRLYFDSVNEERRVYSGAQVLTLYPAESGMAYADQGTLSAGIESVSGKSGSFATNYVGSMTDRSAENILSLRWGFMHGDGEAIGTDESGNRYYEYTLKLKGIAAKAGDRFPLEISQFVGSDERGTICYIQTGTLVEGRMSEVGSTGGEIVIPADGEESGKLKKFEGYFQVQDKIASESDTAPTAEMEAAGQKYYNASVTYRLYFDSVDADRRPSAGGQVLKLYPSERNDNGRAYADQAALEAGLAAATDKIGAVMKGYAGNMSDRSGEGIESLRWSFYSGGAEIRTDAENGERYYEYTVELKDFAAKPGDRFLLEIEQYVDDNGKGSIVYEQPGADVLEPMIQTDANAGGYIIIADDEEYPGRLKKYEGYFEVFDAEAVESSVAPSAEMRAEGKKYYDAEVTYRLYFDSVNEERRVYSGAQVLTLYPAESGMAYADQGTLSAGIESVSGKSGSFATNYVGSMTDRSAENILSLRWGFMHGDGEAIGTDESGNRYYEYTLKLKGIAAKAGDRFPLEISQFVGSDERGTICYIQTGTLVEGRMSEVGSTGGEIVIPADGEESGKLKKFEGYFQVQDKIASESDTAPTAEMEAAGQKYYNASVTYRLYFDSVDADRRPSAGGQVLKLYPSERNDNGRAYADQAALEAGLAAATDKIGAVMKGYAGNMSDRSGEGIESLRWSFYSGGAEIRTDAENGERYYEYTVELKDFAAKPGDRFLLEIEQYVDDNGKGSIVYEQPGADVLESMIQTDANAGGYIIIEGEHILTYCDGADGAVFADEVYEKLVEGDVLPAFEGSTDREGYVFKGWNTDLDGNGTAYVPGTDVMPNGNLVLYAQWKKLHTVSFDASGAGGEMAALEIEDGESGIVPENGFDIPEKKAFKGWNTDPDGNGTAYAPGDEITPTEDVVLYAQWMKLHTVSFDAGGACGEMDALEIEDGESGIVPENGFDTPEKKIFKGWNTDPEGNGTAYAPGDEITPTEDVVLYAQWLNIYTVSFDASGAGGEMAALEIVEGESGVVPDNGFDTPEKKIFKGWNTDPDGNGTAYAPNDEITPTEDMVLYAQWENESETVIFVRDGEELDVIKVLRWEGMHGEVTGEGRTEDRGYDPNHISEKVTVKVNDAVLEHNDANVERVKGLFAKFTYQYYTMEGYSDPLKVEEKDGGLLIVTAEGKEYMEIRFGADEDGNVAAELISKNPGAVRLLQTIGDEVLENLFVTPGDINLDGKMNANDWTTIMRWALLAEPGEYDVVDIPDFTLRGRPVDLWMLMADVTSTDLTGERKALVNAVDWTTIMFLMLQAWK